MNRSTADTPESGRVGTGKAEEALRAAVAFYQDQLGQDHQARAFLRERGVTKESMNRWQLGYAPPSWDSLIKTLRSEGISDKILLETGLAGQARTGRLYDRMRGRVIFPIHDGQGSSRGFAGRLITGNGPKYLNSPETPLYKKSKLLYGLDLAQPAVAENKGVAPERAGAKPRQGPHLTCEGSAKQLGVARTDPRHLPLPFSDTELRRARTS